MLTSLSSNGVSGVKTIVNSSVSSLATHNSDNSHIERLTKCYQADQQVKYLHLQAEIEMLLQQLKTVKQQKLQASASEN